MKLYVVICTYSVKPKLILDKFLKFSNQYNLNIRGVLVQNNDNIIDYKYKNWIILKGTNKMLDFSAYYEGLTYFQNELTEGDPILFFNDTLFLKHDFYFSLKELFKYLDLITEIQLNAMVGFKSNYNSICLVNPWSNIDAFIPTYVFLINYNAICVFNNILHEIYSLNLEMNEEIFDSLPISSKFKELLKAHTFYSKSPITWKNSNINSLDIQLLCKKALCVYFEHKLSGEIGSNGGLIFLNASRRFQIHFLLRETLIRFFKNILWR